MYTELVEELAQQKMYIHRSALQTVPFKVLNRAVAGGSVDWPIVEGLNKATEAGVPSLVSNDFTEKAAASWSLISGDPNKVIFISTLIWHN